MPIARKTLLKLAGELVPSIYNDELNHISYFITPVAHKFYEKECITEDDTEILKENWTALPQKDIETALSLGDTKDFVKNNFFKHQCEDFAKFDKKKLEESLDNRNPFYLQSKKYTNKVCYLHGKDKNKQEQQVEFKCIGIDLWILDGNIAFFVLKTKIMNGQLNIDGISSFFNRLLRDFSSLTVFVAEDKIDIYHSSYEAKANAVSYTDFLMSLTKNEKRSLLNITNNQKEFGSKIKSIIYSTAYSKMLTAIHINEESIVDDKETIELAPLQAILKEVEFEDFGHLSEMAYLLGTTSSFDFESEKRFIPDENYVYSQLKKYCIQIWKNWSGVSLFDSLAFFAIQKNNSSIVYEASTKIYFIYILSLYVNMRLKLLENALEDEEFLDFGEVKKATQSLQLVKNKYMFYNVSSKFQPNHIHKAINSSLENYELLQEIEANIINTHQLTKDNSDIILTIASWTIALLGFYINQGVIKEFFAEKPALGFLLAIGVIVVLAGVYIKRFLIVRKIRKWFRISSAKITSILGSSW